MSAKTMSLAIPKDVPLYRSPDAEARETGKLFYANKLGAHDATQLGTMQRHPDTEQLFARLLQPAGLCSVTDQEAYLMPSSAAFYSRLIRLIDLARSHWTPLPSNSDLHPLTHFYVPLTRHGWFRRWSQQVPATGAWRRVQKGEGTLGKPRCITSH